jgi:7,8-dihydropterin-6-yl-methyl-4-(beta-D-ribofuranosyl)aminobenzene 5'-phosphate synthase
MRIVILFDEKAAVDGLRTGFGLSLLVDDTVLFDVGSDGEAVLHNIRAMNIDTSCIRAVVLSHEHWDHTDGLAEVLSALRHPKVYVCPAFPERLKETIRDSGATVETSRVPTAIAEGVYTSGEMPGVYKGAPMPEQSLVVRYKRNHAALVCGCAHYGIAQSIAELRARLAGLLGGAVALDAIVGGMHLSNESDDTLADISTALQRSERQKNAVVAAFVGMPRFERGKCV